MSAWLASRDLSVERQPSCTESRPRAGFFGGQVRREGGHAVRFRAQPHPALFAGLLPRRSAASGSIRSTWRVSHGRNCDFVWAAA